MLYVPSESEAPYRARHEIRTAVDLTFSKKSEPFLRTLTLGVSNGSKRRLSLVQVMKRNGGLAWTWQRTTPDIFNGRYWTVGVNVTRAASAFNFTRQQ